MIELLVVLALSGIIFSMALLVFTIVKQQTLHQEKTHETVWAWSQLQLLLQKDLQQAGQVRRAGAVLTLSGKAWDIEYQFSSSYITRTLQGTTTHTDTFNITTTTWESQWQGVSVTAGLVDHLILESRLFEQPTTLVVHKKYGSHAILNANTND